MTEPTKPKAVHVYRTESGSVLTYDRKPFAMSNTTVYLGEYVPAPGPIVDERYEVSWWDDCSGEWQIDGEWHVSEDRRAREKAHEMFREKKKEWPRAKYRIVHTVTRKAAK